jgi:hypothetical protein
VSANNEVDVHTLEFAGAGAAQREPVGMTPFGDEGMHFVQQGGQALDFVHYDPTALRPCLDLLAERPGLPGQSEECLCSQKIEPQRIREDMPQPRRLAGPARAE